MPGDAAERSSTPDVYRDAVEQSPTGTRTPTGRVPGEKASVARNLALQRRFYGEPLGDRVRRLLSALDISQAALSACLGLSQAMLSQLMSGRRAKIGKPVVMGRLLLLEHLMATAQVTHHDPDGVVRALAAVRAAEPTVAGDQYRKRVAVDVAVPSELLRIVAAPDELARAADALDPGHPRVAAFLRQVAGDA